MNRCILVTRPSYDRPTRYISAWAEIVIKEARKRGEKVLDLVKERVNRKVFESMVVHNKPSLIFLNGHGDYDRISGHDHEILIQAGDNESVLSSAIVYNLSCRAAAELGERSIQSGTTAFIGYKNNFVLINDPTKRTRPLEDEIAKLFLVPSNQVVTSLLKGHTVTEAHQASLHSSFRNISRMLTSEASDADRSIIPYLLWNAKSQVCLGDRQARM